MNTHAVTNAGRPPRVSDEEILAVFHESSDPVLIASEVAEELPIGRRGVYKRLEQLAEEGELGRKKIGGRGTVWWLAGLGSEDSQESDTSAENGE
jgi:predicted ArsR family transcriptional regulator